MRPDEFFRHELDLVPAIEHGRHLRAHGVQPQEERLDVGRGQGAAQLGEAQRQQLQRGDLGDEGLGRGDRDLESRARVDHGVGLARERGIDDVGDGDHVRAPTLGLARRLDRVDRLAALGDADHQGADLDDRVAVAVLTRDVDLDADPGPSLDRVLGDQRGVVRRTRRDQHHALDLAQLLVTDAQFVKGDGSVAAAAVEQRRADGVGLLVDLLGHEVVVAALLCGLEVPVDWTAGAVAPARPRGRWRGSPRVRGERSRRR